MFVSAFRWRAVPPLTVYSPVVEHTCWQCGAVVQGLDRAYQCEYCDVSWIRSAPNLSTSPTYDREFAAVASCP